MQKLKDYLKQNPKKHLIFDFDATIFALDWTFGESIPEYRKRIRKVAKAIDPEITASIGPEQRSCVLLDALVKKHGEIATDKIFPFYKEKENTLIPTAKPNPEIIDFIKNADQDYKLYIWSSNMTDTFKTVLATQDLNKYFRKTVGRDNVKLAKPNPDGFELIYQPGTEKSEYLMIGDSDADQGAAKNAEIDFFLVDYFDRVQ